MSSGEQIQAAIPISQGRIFSLTDITIPKSQVIYLPVQYTTRIGTLNAGQPPWVVHSHAEPGASFGEINDDQVSVSWSSFTNEWDVSRIHVPAWWELHPTLEQTTQARSEYIQALSHASLNEKIRKVFVVGLGSMYRSYGSTQSQIKPLQSSLRQHMLVLQIMRVMHATALEEDKTPQVKWEIVFEDTYYTKEDRFFIRQLFASAESFGRDSQNEVEVWTDGSSFKRVGYESLDPYLFIAFKPNNPYREIIADLCVSESKMKGPRAIICRPPYEAVDQDTFNDRVDIMLETFLAVDTTPFHNKSKFFEVTVADNPHFGHTCLYT